MKCSIFASLISLNLLFKFMASLSQNVSAPFITFRLPVVVASLFCTHDGKLFLQRKLYYYPALKWQFLMKKYGKMLYLPSKEQNNALAKISHIWAFFGKFQIFLGLTFKSSITSVILCPLFKEHRGRSLPNGPLVGLSKWHMKSFLEMNGIKKRWFGLSFMKD